MSIDSLSVLPPRLAEILETFGLSDPQGKMELLLEFAESLLPIPEELADLAGQPELVPECMTPVTVYMHQHEGRLRFYFGVPPEAPTIRGYAAILQQGLWDVTPNEVLQIPEDLYSAMGLLHILTPQRVNGLIAILAHIKRLATQALTLPPASHPTNL
ncbi:SufE family protein [uncultured Thermanaerothrix sp.]|uniref:SufE family protein n=1 Tax=uncultured Thermanaerothrix sp. TaxID=1195149 RepID=UPI002612AEBF|nr:SufE family protein [uncultured Thermanaerothrix sp.]